MGISGLLVERGVIPRYHYLQAGNDHARALAVGMSKGTVGVYWRVRPVAVPLAILSVYPPKPAIATVVLGLVVRYLPRAHRALSGDHLRCQRPGTRNRVGYGTRHGHHREFPAPHPVRFVPSRAAVAVGHCLLGILAVIADLTGVPCAPPPLRLRALQSHSRPVLTRRCLQRPAAGN